jgi:hypothetical protein
VIEYPGAHHTLEFEEPRAFVQDVVAWLNARSQESRVWGQESEIANQ